MGGGGGGGDSETTVRYAPYVEMAHQSFLSKTAGAVSTARARNPYTGFVDIPIDVGFFGAGYTLASFPAAYELFERYVKGLDIDDVWNRLFTNTMEGGANSSLTEAHSAILQDDIDNLSLPKFMAGMRDIGAVNSSSFVIGRAVIQDSKDKQVAKYAAELSYRLLPLVQDRFKNQLAWNTGIVSQYVDLMKYYFTIKQSITSLNYEIKDLGARWDLEMLDYERAAMGAIQGAMKSKTSGGGPSKGTAALGGAVSGAAIGGYIAAGTSVGGPWGAAIGAVVGGVAALLAS